MKLEALRNSLFATFKLIAFVGFIIAGALTAALVYEKIYKKALNYDEKKIDEKKVYFYIIAAIIEAAFIYIFTLLFKNTSI